MSTTAVATVCGDVTGDPGVPGAEAEVPLSGCLFVHLRLRTVDRIV